MVKIRDGKVINKEPNLTLYSVRLGFVGSICDLKRGGSKDEKELQ